MKYILTIISFVLSLIFAQDRSIIHTTGAPEGTEGFDIYWDGTTGQSVSNRIFASQNMALEAIRIYAIAENDSSLGRVVLQSDNQGLPGEEIYSWDINVSLETHGSNTFLIVTTDLCLYLDEGNYYWITMHAQNTQSQITWIYSNSANFTFTTTYLFIIIVKIRN